MAEWGVFKSYAIIRGNVHRRMEPIIGWAFRPYWGIHPTSKAAKARWVREMIPDAAQLPDDKLVDHFDRQYRNEKMFKVMKLTEENRMYLVDTAEGPVQMQRMNDTIGGPGFHTVDIAAATKMEAWGSSVTDEGEDFSEFRLIDEKGWIMKKRKVTGY
jgi:hypothetical protein